MKSRLLILSVIAAFLLPAAAFAQGSAEMEAAKQFAKQYGYSESEIENILSSQQGSNKNSNLFINPEGEESLNSSTRHLTNPTILPRAKKREEEATVYDADGNPIEKDETKHVYGHKFFDSNVLGIVPSVNTAVPESYILGPGDEVTIDIWGGTTAKVNSVIAKDGTVLINGVGPVTIGGMNVSRAATALKKKLSKIYGDLDQASHLRLSVNRMRTITVNVVGDVLVPGAYAVPALTQIASAVYMAGGVEETASVRDIRLYREGKLVGTFDFYEFMFKGTFDPALKLEDNDIVSVPSYKAIVTVEGEAMRPMLYEVKEGDSVADVITYAGGFTPDGLTDMVYLERKEGENQSFAVKESEFSSFRVKRGDLIHFNAIQIEPANRVCVNGAVQKPGFYPLSGEISSVKDLLENAGGLNESANKARATMFRKDADMRPSSIHVNIKDVMSGRVIIPLQRGDSLYVYESEELRKDLDIKIYGAVNTEGIYTWRPGMTVYDLVMEAGGFAEGADMTNIEIARKGRRDKGYVKTLNLEADPSAGEEVLYSDDNVFVRLMSNFRDPQVIQINGEVSFPGAYAIDKTIVRLSDIVERAGGFTTDAYVKGAQLERQVTDLEKDRTEMAVTLAAQQENVKEAKDSLAMVQKDYIPIGIDLEAAVKNPGSDADVVLRTGDIITIPQLNNTVKISGAVFYPNTVVYNPSYTWRDYINQAGGMEKKAKARNIYAVYMNGQVARKGSANFKMEPGMELVVVEEKKDGEKITATELATISSLAISIAYMVTAVVRMFM